MIDTVKSVLILVGLAALVIVFALGTGFESWRVGAALVVGLLILAGLFGAIADALARGLRLFIR
jgi:hypothetical protein